MLFLMTYLNIFLVHLHVRKIDLSKPKTNYPSTSSNTYWEVETENGITNGNTIRIMSFFIFQLKFQNSFTSEFKSFLPATKDIELLNY